MRVDFYLLSHDPAEALVAHLALKAKQTDERLLVVSADDAQLDTIDRTLWEFKPTAFLAHGRAEAEHAERQPVLLSKQTQATNGAKLIALADGEWREEATAFARAFLVFDEMGRKNARSAWKDLSARDGVECHFWQQKDGRWCEAA